VEVNVRTVDSLFLPNNVRYEVPIYQRPYVWNRSDQWEPLWSDVCRVAENYLNTTDSDDQNEVRPHFIGALVLQQQASSAGEIDARHIIDGQQRLTTIQLLLDAVQEVFEDLEVIDRRHGRFMKRLVLNDELFSEVDSDHAYKVWPASEDQEPFRKAMDNNSSTEGYESSTVVQAHEFFRAEAHQWLAESLDSQYSIEQRANALKQTLAKLLQMVVIDIRTQEDAQMIFETLNARGTPLLASDLIKNFIIQEANRTGLNAKVIYEDHLKGFEKEWWRRIVGSGQNARPRIDAYLYHWLTMQGRGDVLAGNIFSSFQRYVTNEGRPIDEFSDEIRRFSHLYEELEEAKADDSYFGKFLYRWRVMQAGVATPVLMWLLWQRTNNKLSNGQFVRTLRAIESYLVRWMVCYMSTAQYDRLFRDLLGYAQDQPITEVDDSIVGFLANQSAAASVWPDDATLSQAFEEQPLYWRLSRARLRFVLEALGDQLRTKFGDEGPVPKGLTIEHVMPQEWKNENNWPIGDGSQQDDPTAILNAARVRDNSIHTIGNLTLLTQNLNSALSNSPWTKKRDLLEKHSALSLTRRTLLHEETWDEGAIRRRASVFFEAAAKVWPHMNTI
jgi:hypothetical protein